MFQQLLVGLTSFLFVSLFQPSPTPSPQPEPSVASESSVSAEKVQSSDLGSPEPTPQASPRAELFFVSRVIDGDTIEVTRNGKKQTVRLIGIDTPETVDPRKPVQCFGAEASRYLKELVEGKELELIADPTQGNTDKYARLLRYLILDGNDVAQKIIRDGYGQEYTYSKPYANQEKYKEAQKLAQAEVAGLWNPDACPAPSPQPTASPSPRPTPTPVVKASPPPAASPGVRNVGPPAPKKKAAPTSAYVCNCAKTCSQMSYAEAQYQLNTCGCSRRDGDNDGIACER